MDPLQYCNEIQTKSISVMNQTGSWEVTPKGKLPVQKQWGLPEQNRLILKSLFCSHKSLSPEQSLMLPSNPQTKRNSNSPLKAKLPSTKEHGDTKLDSTLMSPQTIITEPASKPRYKHKHSKHWRKAGDAVQQDDTHQIIIMLGQQKYSVDVGSADQFNKSMQKVQQHAKLDHSLMLGLKIIILDALHSISPWLQNLIERLIEQYCSFRVRNINPS